MFKSTGKSNNASEFMVVKLVTDIVPVELGDVSPVVRFQQSADDKSSFEICSI